MSLNYYDSVTVNYPEIIVEKKAPTDESIRLLNEFEEKARANIIAKVVVDDNTINGVAIAYTRPYATASDTGEIHFKFKINGKEYTFKDTYKLFETVDYKKELDLTRWLSDRFKAKIAAHIMFELSKQILENLKNNGQ